MCHEYGMRWWRSEKKTANTKTEDAKPDVRATAAAPRDEKIAKPAPEKQVEEKELEPAE